MTPHQVERLLLALGLGLLVLLALIGAVVWRNLRLRGRLRALLAGMPTPLLLAWYGRVPDPRQARSVPVRTGAEAEQLGADSLSTVEVLFQLSRLDRSPLLSYAPKRVPSNVDALAAQIRDASAAESREGSGYEPLLSDQLRRQGHDVQPAVVRGDDIGIGVRALVDGQPVQLIGSVQAEDVRAFLEAVPKIPVVTFADHEEPFLDTARVVALEQVKSERVQDIAFPSRATAELDAAVEPAGAGQVRPETEADPTLDAIKSMGSLVAERSMSPFLLTALKSAQLAANGDGSWKAQAKSGLVDHASGAAGGWAGARAGAMAGALLGPLGSAAGTWLGGLVGKKVVEGIAGHQKSKKLRALVKRQDGFLAKVPRAVSEALLAQAVHLDSAAEDLRPTGTRRYFPSVGDAARTQVARQYTAWAKDSLVRGEELKKWLTKNSPSESKRAARGRKLLEGATLAWSKDVVDLRAELLFLAPQIEEAAQRAAE